MKILEVRDGFIKFESLERFPITSFIKIEDDGSDYIAQVLQVNRGGESVTTYAKLVYCYNGSLCEYDGTLPSKNSNISEFSFDLINKKTDYKTPATIGSFISGDYPIYVDNEALNRQLLISFEDQEKANSVIKNLSNGIDNNVIIIDMLGKMESSNKFVAAQDFKLPLNSETLSFMYEDCLNDATQDSKSLIKEIFQDLSDYSKTVDFLPFSALKNIVDNMVEKEHIFKLLILKNKLSKFDKQGYFARDNEEATNLSRILDSKYALIDISKLDSIFQNRYLLSIYSELSKKKEKPQIFVIGTNFISKASLKTILMSTDIPSVFVTHPRFKFINDIKSMFKNFIIEPNFTNNDIFKFYSKILCQLKDDSYLIAGECTNNLPLASTYKETITLDKNTNQQNVNTSDYKLDIEKKSEELIEKLSTEIEETEETQITENIFSDDSNELDELDEIEEVDETENTVISEEIIENAEQDLESDVVNEEIIDVLDNSDDNEFHTNVDDTTIIQLPEEISAVELDDNDDAKSNDIIIDTEPPTEEIVESSLDEIDVLDYNLNENISIANEVVEDNINLSEISIEENDVLANTMQGINEENNDDIFNEIIDNNDDDSIVLDDNDKIPDDVILVDLSNEEQEEQIISEDIEQEIIEDVDKVFTTIKDDSISDSDLDFIDELNGDGNSEELLTEFEEVPVQIEEEDDDGFIEDLIEVGVQKNNDDNSILETKNATTPIVPVYEAEIPEEDKVVSDPIDQGDSVYHSKHGNGIVEKIIKYGTKTLYSINFDNVGRRLLDPTLTEIKKV